MFKKGMNKLQKAYEKGFTVYPRVSNDYIIEPLTLFYPHPPLNSFDKYSKPLNEEYYDVKWQSLPLLLENLSISTPATIIRNLSTIEKFYNRDLSIKKDMELNDKLKKFEIFVNRAVKEKVIKDKDSVKNLLPDDVVAKKYMTIKAFRIKTNINNLNLKRSKRKDSIKNFKGLDISDKELDINLLQDEIDLTHRAMLIADKNTRFDLNLLELESILSETKEDKSKHTNMDYIKLSEYEEEFEEWKLKIRNRYKSKKIDNFYIKKDEDKVILIGKNQYKGVKLIDDGLNIIGLGDNITSKANAIIEVALAKGWNINNIEITGSVEFKKAVKVALLNRKLEVSNEPKR